MTIKLPQIIKKYVDASNRHDVKFILSCFAKDALVHDEGKVLRGQKAIEAWVVKTIAKYKFHFTPLSVKDDNTELVVRMEVSGTFDGSPISLDYHFVIVDDKILSLRIG